MKRIFQTGLVITYAIILVTCAGSGYSTRPVPREQYVVMLSMDGCRWDYPQLAPMPNLERMAKQGVKAASLQPVFPSKTFPNHYAIATGLYADRHGIVQNSFYDAEMDAYYKISDRTAVENGAFYSGEPIWVTAEKQGVRSASFFWVGTEAPVQGRQPSIWKRYQHDFPFEARVDTVIAWLQLPKKQRPRLITWYFHEPDGVGHRYGPDSRETRDMLIYLDSLVGDFLDKLSALPIADQVNVIVTADHGMADISRDRVVVLDEYIDRDWVLNTQGGSPVWLLDIEDEFIDTVVTSLQSAPHVQAWKQGTLPDYLHFGTNPRVLDVIVAADNGWSVLWSDELEEQHFSPGTHGFDPTNKDMHAIFYALGPAFKVGYVQPTFENVNIYALIARLLDIQPAETDGDLYNIEGMLRAP